MTRFFPKTSLRSNVLPFFLFFLSAVSCVTNDREYGKKFITEDLLLEIDTATIDLVIKNRALDSIQGTSTAGMLLGYVNDSLYGTTNISTASFVAPLTDSAYLGIEPRLTDIYLTLVVDSSRSYIAEEYGIPQNLYVYEMLRELDSTMLFNYSIKREDYSDKPVSQGAPIIFGPGTIKIQLSDEYGRKLLSASRSEFADVSMFLKRFNGLYLRVDNDKPEVMGGRLNFLSLASSTITVDYVMNDPERQIFERDTSISFVFGYYYALNQFNAGSKHLDNDNPGEVLYMEGLAGVKPVITAAELKSQLDVWASRVIDSMKRKSQCCEDFYIVISKASVNFPYEMPDDYDQFELEHPRRIFGFRHDTDSEDSSRFMTPTMEVYRDGGGVMDRAYMEYVCDFTGDIQRLLKTEPSKVTDSLDIWIAPLYKQSTTGTSNTLYYTYDVTDYWRLKLNGPKAKRHPQLSLTYAVMMD